MNFDFAISRVNGIVLLSETAVFDTNSVVHYHVPLAFLYECMNDFSFKALSAVFQSYWADGRVTICGCMQKNTLDKTEYLMIIRDNFC